MISNEGVSLCVTSTSLMMERMNEATPQKKKPSTAPSGRKVQRIRPTPRATPAPDTNAMPKTVIPRSKPLPSFLHGSTGTVAHESPAIRLRRELHADMVSKRMEAARLQRPVTEIAQNRRIDVDVIQRARTIDSQSIERVVTSRGGLRSQRTMDQMRPMARKKAVEKPPAPPVAPPEFVEESWVASPLMAKQARIVEENQTPRDMRDVRSFMERRFKVSRMKDSEAMARDQLGRPLSAISGLLALETVKMAEEINAKAGM
ncbi:hypothetical protein J8273_5453 [Carpediemonas membranifera]|uniref:Uncharacterized protein n=1 Tax=Carpediemonas membranifera TaxID=201153 RepID=A0A8J6ARI5_9EUKA|nr:hypothetical protein J8273_5453 [Carpediemonas membranifera]|eukprot:KAG9392461.1 hypothetical protein J8273_5453 [Carpediemonas membranifera]